VSAEVSHECDVAIVGNGLFGAAATRHLAERGQRVVNVGAASSGPDIRQRNEPTWPSHRVYSSHNDAARLTRLQDRDPVWTAVTRRAVSRYRQLEQDSGVRFYHDVGCLIVSQPGGDGTSPDPLDMMAETGVDHDYFAPGDSSWKQHWPAIAFPTSHYVAFESSPAGFIRPKQLIRAQNVLAERAGATHVVDTVTSVQRHRIGHAVETADGRRIEAAKVLVCTGAFVNFNRLLPAPQPVSLKSEVIALGEVSPADALALRDFPTVKYLIDSDDLEGIYMVAPVRYQDGKHYIKMGANTRLDHPMTELSAIQQWFNADTDPAYLPLFEPELRRLWPDVDFVSVRTQSCVITYSPDRRPSIVDHGNGLYVATAGNGGGAKGSDAWGEIAADLVERG